MFEVFIFTNGIFLGVLLLIQRSELRNANLFLAFSLISLSLELAPDLFEEEADLLPDTSFFTVPLLFLYAQRIMQGRLKARLWLWLVPGIIVNIVTLIITDEPPDLWLIILLLVPFYAFNLYLLFSLHRRIILHQRQLKEQYANLETRTLSWIRGLVIIFLIFHFVWILDDGLLIMDFDFQVLPLIAQLLTLAAVFWVGYHGFGQRASALFLTAKVEKSSANMNETKGAEEMEQQFELVLSKLKQNKLYLNQELTLRLLAQQVGVNEKRLSAWINKFTENNFYHLINQYRIAEFKEQLAQPENQNFSLLGIAQNSGFKNKSTFYKVFKELEGITPNDYKKRLSEA